MPHLSQNETLAAKQSYIDYVSLGPGRTVRKLHDLYLQRAADGEDVATKSYNTLNAWKENWQWDKRIEAILEKELKAAEKREKDYRKEILETGYALAHERIRELKALAKRLLDEIDTPKITAKNMAGIVNQLRGVMDDIAKEQGQRKIPAEESKGAPVIIYQSSVPRPTDNPVV